MVQCRNLLILLISHTLFVISIGCQNVSENPKSGSIEIDSGYFKLVDDTNSSASPRNLNNLELKRGFKNLYLGTLFSDYNFNKSEFKTSKYCNDEIVFCVKSFENDTEYINGVKLSQIELLFFKGKLSLINVIGADTIGKDQKLLSLLSYYYGNPTNELKPIARGRHRVEFVRDYIRSFTDFTIVKNKQGLIPKNIFTGSKNRSVNANKIEDLLFIPSTTLRLDPDNEEWYSEEVTTNFNEWKSKNVKLIYEYWLSSRGYHRQVNDGDSPSPPNYMKYTSRESMAIINYKAIEEARDFIENYFIIQQHHINDSIRQIKDQKSNIESIKL